MRIAASAASPRRAGVTLALWTAVSIAVHTVAPSQTLVDVTPASGLGGFPLSTLDFGTGLCAGDFDGDGDVDLVIPDRPGHPIRFFRNDGGMQFADTSAASGLGLTGNARACQAADVDNDGDLDVLIGNSGQLPQLWINDGLAHFTDEAAARGLTHTTSQWSAGFGDYDNDGWLDLYVGNRFRGGVVGLLEPNILYRNVGGGQFVDVTAQAGVAHSGGATFVGAFFDQDEDGWPDLFCANDFGQVFAANELYRNNGDGTFGPAGAALDADDAMDAMGFDFVDAFCDGGLDYFCSDNPADHLFRVFDPALGRYVDETARFGLTAGLIGWAAHFADFDNDGWPDLHVVHAGAANHLYRNPAQPRAAGAPWIRAANPSSPTAFQTTAVVADFDDDGRVDVLHRMIGVPGEPAAHEGLVMQRNVAPLQHWISVRAVGAASNRDGLGARIEARAGGRTQRQYVRQNTGFLSGNDRRCHFGLGRATHVDLEVHWPSGQVQSLRGLAADRVYTVTEPGVTRAGAARVGSQVALTFEAPYDVGMHGAILLGGAPAPGTPLPDGSVLPLAFDGLTAVSVTPHNGLISGNLGPLQNGAVRATLSIPPLASAAGLTLFAAGFTYDPATFAIGTVGQTATAIAIGP